MHAPDDALRQQELMRRADPASNLEPAQAEQAAREAEAWSRRLGLTRETLQAGVWLARHLFHLGRHAQALAQAQAVLASPPAGAESALVAEALRLTALAACELGQFDVAIDAAQSLMQRAAAAEDAATPLNAAIALAVCFERLGDMWQAERLLSRALEAHGERGPDVVVASACNALCAVCAQVARLLHDSDAPEERLSVLERGRVAGEKGMLIAGRLGAALYQAVLQTNLAEVLIGAGQYDQACRLLEQALAIAERQGLSTYGQYARMLLADAWLHRGDASRAFRLAVGLLAEAGDGTAAATLSRLHDVAARAASAMRRYKVANDHLVAAQQIERRLLTTQMRIQSELLVTRSEELRARQEADRARRDAREQQARAAQLQADAERDSLTGIGNRRHLERRASELLSALSEGAQALTLVMFDVDHFKQVNDRHGHAAGDAVLVALASQASRCIRGGDVLVRHGGEEFVLLLPGAGLAEGQEISERLRGQVERMTVESPGGTKLSVTISIGLAAAPAYSLPELLARADAALYEAKRGGRNRVCLAAAQAEG